MVHWREIKDIPTTFLNIIDGTPMIFSRCVFKKKKPNGI